MRFNRLDVIRYGVLTERSLVFRPDAKLHVIYGPNEAGKSSALKAISDLLFGFPRSTSHYSFLHDAATLRIGAEIAGKDGTSLAFRRRRGTKNTLLGIDEKESPLPEDALAPYLGNLGREVFERAFGLDSERLRGGAAEMLKSGGEIGSLLFSAASGLTGLTRLRQSLEGEADGIYAQRRSKDRSFYQALDRHDEARRLERESELRSGDWKKLVSEATETEAELDGLRREREETKRALHRLLQLKKLEPLLREIDAERALLEGFDDLQPMPSGTEERLSAALEAHRRAEEARRAADHDVRRLESDLEGIALDHGLLKAAGTIIERYAEKGAYRKAKDDIGRVRGEVEDFDLRIGQLAHRLGTMRPEELEARQPTEAMLARLRALASEGGELKRTLADTARRLDEERDRLRRLGAGETVGRLIDPKPYLQRLSALQAETGDVLRIDGLQVKLDRARSDLTEAVSRLSPAVDDLDRLLAAPLPDLAALAEHRRRLQEADAGCNDAMNALVALETERQEARGELVALESGGVIVTREDIDEARGLRDERLAAVEQGAPLDASVLKASIREADRLVDDALRDAERVSHHARLTLRLDRLERSIAAAGERKADADRSMSLAEGQYRTLFAAAGLDPLAPEAMIDWRRAVEALSARRDAVNALADEVAVLERRRDRLLPALIDIADATGLSAAQSLPLPALEKALSQHIADIGQRWTDSRSVEGERQTLADAIARLEERKAEIREKASLWQAGLADAAGEVGLPDDATVDMVEAVVDVWRDLPQHLAERENRRRRVRGMQRDIEAFEERIGSLVETLASDLATFSAEAAIDMLHDRVMAANSGEQRRKSLSDALAKARSALAACLAAAEEAESGISVFAEGLPPATELPRLLERLVERRQLDESLVSCRRRFQAQAEGVDEAQARMELESFDRIEADLEIERLEALDGEHLQRFGTLSATLAENRRQRAALETASSAEYAVFERHAAEEEAKGLARQWVILKLAAYMLGTSMEAYRERQADPVMKRAGEIFSTLTGGRFARLVQDYGGDDELQLLAERLTGERVPIGGLSEGTGDQLYLALRLAFLEDYAARNEPAPLVVDDIFQTFDDDRTAAGLKALAGSSDRFQTVLFTHESSVVDIASREIGGGLDLIRL